MDASNLTERQKVILSLVIQDHIKTTQPVGSEHLVEEYHLDKKPATVRNELVALTSMGYLRQPHTSAGRVPTEEGYRYFVRTLMGQTELPATTRRTITHQFYQAGYDVDRWMRLAASILAQQSHAAALVTAPHVEQSRFKHLELISTFGRQVLMVLVLDGGEMHQQMLALAEPVPQDQLSVAASTLNHLLHGLKAEELSTVSSKLNALEQDILRLVADEMRRSHEVPLGEVYRDGLSHVLSAPEFSESDSGRKALRVIEEPMLLEDLLSRTVLSSDADGIQVLIGGEGTWEELSECSVVLGRYGAPGLATGTLGVLGPTRMTYGRNISMVRFIAGLLSDLVNDMLEK